MKELNLGSKTYFVVDDSLPAYCFRVLEDTEIGEYIEWAKGALLREPDITPRNIWHPVIQNFILIHKA